MAKTIEQFKEMIKSWYEENHQGFRNLFDNAIRNVNPVPAGQSAETTYDWRGKSIYDLCRFFDDWYHSVPTVKSGLDYILKFGWLYYDNIYGLIFITTEPGLTMTREFIEINAAYMDSEESKQLVLDWQKEPGMIMEDFKVPEGGFKTFNHFFTREIKDNARPICSEDDDSVVVAPADCIINMIINELSPEKTIPVKTVSLNIKELLNNSKYTDKFTGGTAVSCILMPESYHHYHSPVAGTVVEAYENVDGVYFGIKDYIDLMRNGNVGYAYDHSVFENFRRGYLIIKTEIYGYVGMVPVGLATIASVVFKDKFKNVKAPVDIRKGEEIGYFKYGGSLVILLFEKDRFPALRILQGQRIGKLNE